MTSPQKEYPSSEPKWVKILDGSDKDYRLISMYELKKIEHAINETEPGHLKEMHDSGNETIDTVRSRPHIPAPETCKKYWMYRSHSGHLYHLLFDLLGREFPEDESVLADALMEVRENQEQHDTAIRNAVLDALTLKLIEVVIIDGMTEFVKFPRHAISNAIDSLRGEP